MVSKGPCFLDPLPRLRAATSWEGSMRGSSIAPTEQRSAHARATLSTGASLVSTCYADERQSGNVKRAGDTVCTSDEQAGCCPGAGQSLTVQRHRRNTLLRRLFLTISSSTNKIALTKRFFILPTARSGVPARGALDLVSERHPPTSSPPHYSLPKVIQKDKLSN